MQSRGPTPVDTSIKRGAWPAQGRLTFSVRGTVIERAQRFGVRGLDE